MPQLSRQQIGNIYRPQGPKALVTGSTWAPASGGQVLISGAQVDLTVPLEGFRIVVKFRDVIAVNAMTSANPFGYLNVISRILVNGKNARQGGNATLWDIDMPSLAVIQTTVKKKPFIYNGVSILGAASAGVELGSDAMSTPVANFFTGATGTYDIRIAIDLPSYPFDCAEYLRPGYYIRGSEWADSLQIRITLPTITSGVANPLGTDNAATTHTFTSFGSAGGSPTVDVYGLPAIMGNDLDSQMTPGFLSRVTVPVTTILQSAGGVNTRLLTLEKQNTTRIWAIIGVSTVTPHFSSVSDANLTTLGMVLGGNKVVRENNDIHAHKLDQVRRYGTQPIQGVVMFDFVPSRNPDSAYNAGDAGDGSTLELRGTVAGVANAQGIFIQETEMYKPQGVLYGS